MDKITSIVEFSNWHKQAVKFPAFEQVIKAQKINNQLMGKLNELRDEKISLIAERERVYKVTRVLKSRLRARQKEYKITQQDSQRLAEATQALKKANLKLTNKYLLAKYKPLEDYRLAHGLSMKKLSKIIGVDRDSLRNLLKYGYPSKYENKVNLFIKSLQSSSK